MPQTNKRLNQEHRAKIKGLTVALCRVSLFGRFVEEVHFMLAHRICKTLHQLMNTNISPNIKQELTGINRNATVEEMGVLRYMIRRLVHDGVGEANPVHAQRCR